MSGAALFARYAFPPNELGYCGPDEAHVLLEQGLSGSDGEEIARRARQFDGAWPYLEILAAAAGVDDPLDTRVVEAYWIGNELLEVVDPATCVADLRSRFAGQVTSRLGTSTGAVPHHSFHVFSVYPWMAMLGRGNDAVALSVLEQCRIRWGTVTGVTGELATVLSEPLVFADGVLQLGTPREASVRWSANGCSLVRKPTEGDLVSLHWDWVCDRLDDAQLAALQRWSMVGMGLMASQL